MAEMHSLIQIFFFCVCVCWSMACEYRFLQKAEEGIRFLGAGVTVGCEPSMQVLWTELGCICICISY